MSHHSTALLRTHACRVHTWLQAGLAEGAACSSSSSASLHAAGPATANGWQAAVNSAASALEFEARAAKSATIERELLRAAARWGAWAGARGYLC